MTEKEKKELFRQLNIELCELCKECGDTERIRYLVNSGADIFFGGLKALSNATKKKNFAAIDILIDGGILSEPRAKAIIASVCDYKNFDDEAETRYFEMLDRAIATTGKHPDYFAPYINSMLIHGKTDKLYYFMARYSLSHEETAAAVYLRMIFETIGNGFANSLEFIDKNIDWMNTAALDAAVASGEIDVIRYIFENSDVGLPSETAIYSAIFEGATEILELLIKRGWNPANNPIYLKKACRSFVSHGDAALSFLLSHGYTLDDIYDGKTIYENAIKDNNQQLLSFLAAKAV